MIHYGLAFVALWGIAGIWLRALETEIIAVLIGPRGWCRALLVLYYNIIVIPSPIDIQVLYVRPF